MNAASPWPRLAAAAGLLTGLGLSTGVYIVLYQPPTLLARLVFFWALVLTVTGLALLPLALLHRRLRRGHDLPASATLLRESLMIGGFMGLWARLQMERLATPGVLMALGAALAMVELAWLVWERRTGAAK